MSVLFVARFKFPLLSTDKVKSLALLFLLFNLSVLNLGSSFIPTLITGADVLPPICVEIFSPTYLKLSFPLKSPDWTFIFAPGTVEILFPTSASISGGADFNCATVTASLSSFPSASWLILLYPTDTTLPLSENGWFVKYPFPSDSCAVTPDPNATEFLNSALEPFPIATEFSPNPCAAGPTATELIPVVLALSPIAIEVAPVARTFPPIPKEYPPVVWAPCPIATEDIPEALVTSSPLDPIAIEFAASELVLSPIAIEVAPVARTFPPIPKEYPPVVWAPCPIATEAVPEALVTSSPFDPIAIEFELWDVVIYPIEIDLSAVFDVEALYPKANESFPLAPSLL